MEILLVSIAAGLAATLTVFSGFGLGTLLMPVLAVFFPLTTAIPVTAVVHFLNNLFKLGLLGRYADFKVVLRFGIPALVAAPLGALSLFSLAQSSPLASYRFLGAERLILPSNLVIALLVLTFGLMEVSPRIQRLSFPSGALPLGGLFAGFLGGLSGHQGALRSTFLLRAGLTKERFIGSGVVIALLIDLGRISVYAKHLPAIDQKDKAWLLVAATLSAFLGSWLGTRWLPKVTLRSIRILVGTLLIGIALGLATGLLGGVA